VRQAGRQIGLGRTIAVLTTAIVSLGACSSTSSTAPTTTAAGTATNTLGATTTAVSTAAGSTPTEATAPGTVGGGTAPATGDATTPASAATTPPVVSTSPANTAPSGTVTAVKAGFLVAADRCAANKAAGPITFVTGLDFAASAATVDVVVAKQARYFEQMCLDVQIKSGRSTENYAAVGQNQVQFGAADSFSEVMQYGASTQSNFVVLSEEGKTPLDTLIVKDGAAPTVADLRGQTIGVDGTMPTPIQAMLAANSLVAGTDYQVADIQQQYGLDPTVQITIPTIAAFPASKSVQPGVLNRAIVKYHTFDPSDADIPGNFGLLYTNQAFATEFPSAVQDFVRASMRGLEDATDDAGAASKTAYDLAIAEGNPAALTADGENYRWRTESDLIAKSTPPGQPYGIPDVAGLQAEIDSDANLGRFGSTKPIIDTHVDVSTIASVYDADGKVIWP